jgi:hypothetical protein
MKSALLKKAPTKANANTTDLGGLLIRQIIISEKARTASIKKKVQSKR